MPADRRRSADDAPTVKLCQVCGLPLGGGHASHQSRRTVTVLFCDVSGFTSLAEEMDPEALRSQMNRYFATAKRIVESHGGTVEKFIGDAVMAVFGLPTMHEDDAVRALRAAAELRAAIDGTAAGNEEHGAFPVRIGVTTGEVIAGAADSGQAFVTGDAVNVAARLQQAAEPGEILVGEETAALARRAAELESAGQLELKGKRGPVAAFRLLTVNPVSQEARRPSAAALVGRIDELNQLLAALRRAIKERRPYLFTVIGTPGVGKSRLVAELSNRSGISLLRGRCLPYGEGITYWPLLEIAQAAMDGANHPPEEPHARLAQRLAEQPDGPLIASRLAATVGWSEERVPAEEAAWAVRRFLEAETRAGPLIAVFDDIQWAEPALLDAVEHVVDWARDAPLLLVCVARPEFLETRPAWGGGKVNATTLLLEPLPRHDAQQMVKQLMESATLPGELLKRITEAADGVPLFLEQIVQMLVEEGHLRQVAGGWRAEPEIGQLPIPATVIALLDARVDALSPAEKKLLGTASVIGEEFDRGPLALVSGLEASSLDSLLLSLMRRELIRPTTSPEEGGFRFRHLLIRDAAYDGLPKVDRAVLHTRFADWLTQRLPERLGELEEIVAHHLETACRYHGELGIPINDELLSRAREHLISAAFRARRRTDWAAANNLLGRAVGLEPMADHVRIELLADLGDSRYQVGDYPGAEEALDEGIALAQTRGDRGAEIRLLAAQSRVRRATQPVAGLRQARELLAMARPVLEARGDDRGLASLYDLESDVAYYEGRIGDALAAVELAMEHARRAADEDRLEGLSNFRIQLAPMHTTPIADALILSEQRLAEVEPGSLTYAKVLAYHAQLTALAGDLDKARRLLDEAAAIHRGVTGTLAFMVERDCRSTVEWLDDNLPAVEESLRDICAKFEAEGEKFYAATYIALLAQVVAEQGRIEEAIALAGEAEELASPDDEWVRMIVRQARALVAAAQGAAGEAVDLAADAVRIAESMEISSFRISALLTQTVVFAAAGRTNEARSSADRARALATGRGSGGEARRADRIAQRLGLANQVLPS